jgi:hypothetical protein
MGGFPSLHLAPLVPKLGLDDWWDKGSSVLADHLRKGLNSIIILGAWSLWNLRSRCILYGDSPNLARALLLVNEELSRRWLGHEPKG